MRLQLNKRTQLAPAGKILLGAITGAHGVKGEVILKVFTEELKAIASYGPLQNEDGSKSFEIEALRPVKTGAAARLKGVRDRNAAEALKGTGLFVDREALGEANEAEDEFFHSDLVGLAAEQEGMGRVGFITAVHNFGAGDMLEIELEGSHEKVLLPFTKEAVPMIDIKGARVVVEPPEGLWDDGSKGPPPAEKEG